MLLHIGSRELHCTALFGLQIYSSCCIQGLQKLLDHLLASSADYGILCTCQVGFEAAAQDQEPLSCPCVDDQLVS